MFPSHVTCEDIQALAKPVLRHRLVMSFLTENDGFIADMLIDKLLEDTPTKEDELFRDPHFQSLFVA